MPFPRAMRRHAPGFVDRIGLRLVGHAAMADIEHAGRRSGVVRHTPVRAFRMGERVVVGLNFGRESDWLKNIQAAGGCTMRLGKQRLTLGAPQVVPLEEGVQRMPWWFGLALRYVVRTVDCVELPILAEAPR
jgi:deazaflavin-dependent oxidoreductase (nitroreductase family)